MSIVKTFSRSYDGMEENAAGDWVKYSDYAALEAKLREAQDELAKSQATSACESK